MYDKLSEVIKENSFKSISKAFLFKNTNILTMIQIILYFS